jgi:hypothetical protein
VAVEQSVAAEPIAGIPLEEGDERNDEWQTTNDELMFECRTFAGLRFGFRAFVIRASSLFALSPTARPRYGEQAVVAPYQIGSICVRD